MSFSEGNMSLSLQFSRGLCDKEFDQVGIPSRMKRYDGQIPVSKNRFLLPGANVVLSPPAAADYCWEEW